MTSTGMSNLRRALESGDFFRAEHEHGALLAVREAFETELNYLKTAYVTSYSQSTLPKSASPSKVLFEDEPEYPEVNRTLTGILSLRWIEAEDYESFTRHQSIRCKLQRSSFEKLCNFFKRTTNNYRDYDLLLALIAMQLINDLGKSAELIHDLKQYTKGQVPSSNNHDVVMAEVLSYCPISAPCLEHLSLKYRSMVPKLVQISAQFNPGQLMQAECPPTSLEVLQDPDLTVEDIDLKFLEFFLAIAGTSGHINHEGASSLIEPVFRSFCKAQEAALDIVEQVKSPGEAYVDVLLDRVKMLHGQSKDILPDFDVQQHEDFALARLLCLARASNERIATLICEIFYYLPDTVRGKLATGLCLHGTVNKPAVLPTYLPSILAQILQPSREDIAEPALDAIFCYLADVLSLTGEDLESLPSNVVIVERDMKDILGNCLKNPGFGLNPSKVLGEAPLPPLQVLKIVESL